MAKADTHAEVDRRYRELMAAKSGAERVRMMSEMFDDGRRILLARYKGAPEDRKEWLFRELYGRDLPDWYIEDFVRWLNRR